MWAIQKRRPSGKGRESLLQLAVILPLIIWAALSHNCQRKPFQSSIVDQYQSNALKLECSLILRALLYRIIAYERIVMFAETA